MWRLIGTSLASFKQQNNSRICICISWLMLLKLQGRYFAEHLPVLARLMLLHVYNRDLGAGVPQTRFCFLLVYEESNAGIILLIIWLRSSAGFLHHSSTLFCRFFSRDRAFLPCPRAAWPPQVAQAELSLGSLPLSACSAETRCVPPHPVLRWFSLVFFFFFFLVISSVYSLAVSHMYTDLFIKPSSAVLLSLALSAFTASPCFILRLCSYLITLEHTCWL